MLRRLKQSLKVNRIGHASRRRTSVVVFFQIILERLMHLACRFLFIGSFVDTGKSDLLKRKNIA